MTTILVVDDSAVDRRLVGGLLAKNDQWNVEYAVQGTDALACIERRPPDLVLTDLIMPEMDGLALVSLIRSHHPSVPVILMTSKGSEEVAVQALHAGAASYVPKRALAQDLLGTVHKILSVSSREKGHVRLLERMSRCDFAFVLENDSSLFSPLVTYLQDSAYNMNVCDDTDRTRIGVALEEALANALYHGNLEVDSRLKEEDDQAYFHLVQQRMRQPPYRDRRIHVEVSLARGEAIFTIRDEGPGFDPESLPDPCNPENLGKPSGRGLLLMRTFMDALVFNRMGNEVRMIKRGHNGVCPAPLETR